VPGRRAAPVARPFPVSPDRALCAIGFLVYLALGSMGPLVPELQRALGASITDLSLVVAVFGLARVCIDVPVASLASRLGPRPLLAAGTACLALAYAGSARVDGVPGLVAAQALAGAGSALCHVSSLAALGAGSSPERSGRMMGAYFSATFGGLSAAGPLSGYVAGHAGWRASFAVAAGAAVGALALVGAWLPRRGGALAVQGRDRADWGRVLHPRLWIIYLLHFTALFLWAGVRGLLWPTLAGGEGGLPVDAVGAALGAGALLSLGALYAAGRAGDRYGKRPVIALGLVAVVSGIALLAASRVPAVLLASLALQDLGQGLMAGNASALLADALRGPGIGLATGVMRLTADVGWLVGPLALGGAAGRWGYGAAVALAAAVPFANLVLLGRRAPGRVPGRPAGPAGAALRS
jgi:MFS family permease